MRPAVPENASPYTEENNLHLLPTNRRALERPWVLYDYIEPCAQYRRMEQQLTRKGYVSEGEDMADLTDTPPIGDESKPVLVPGYA